MKRAISLTLALLLCLSLCACGKNEASDIASQLEGTWSTQSGTIGLTFSNIQGNAGDVESFTSIMGTTIGNSGTFTVEGNSTIHVRYPKEDGKSVDSSMKCIVDNGKVTGIEFGKNVITKE